jgi:carbamate kinase
MISYLIEQTMSNELPHREIATLLTQVEVDSSDRPLPSPASRSVPCTARPRLGN